MRFGFPLESGDVVVLFEEVFFPPLICIELVPFSTQVRDLGLPTGCGDVASEIFSCPSFVPESDALGLKRIVK